MKRYIGLYALCVLTLGMAMAADIKPAPEQINTPKEAKVLPCADWAVLSDGYYLAAGPKDQDGEPAYEGFVMIVKLKKDLYQFSWNIYGRSFVGFGVQQTSTITCSWTRPGHAEVIGQSVYKLSADGKTLTGKQLVMPGDGEWTEETLTFVRGIKVKKAE